MIGKNITPFQERAKELTQESLLLALAKEEIKELRRALEYANQRIFDLNINIKYLLDEEDK